MKDVQEINQIQRIVAGYILNNPGLYVSNIELLSRDLFTGQVRQVITAYAELIKTGSVDLLALSNKTGIGILEITELYTAVDYNIDFKTALSELVTNQISLNLIMVMNETNRKINQGDDVYKVLTDLKEFINSNDLKPVKRISQISEHIKGLVKHMENVSNQKITGIRTGLQQWDSHTGGLQPSDLVIIAAETSQGKTSLALTIAYNASVNTAAKVAIFSLEMSELQLTARLTAMETGISSKKLLFQPLNRYDWEDFNSKLQYLPNADIYIDDCTNSNIDYIISGIKVAHMQHGIQVAVVDYLQLVKDGTKRNDESEIASNTRRFKNVAKELNITVILLSQLRRETNPKPTINRLRGSGQIEEAADLAVLLWRPEYYNIQQYEDSPLPNTAGTAEIIIAKGRNYGIGKFWLNFDPHTTRFTNIESYGTTDQKPAF